MSNSVIFRVLEGPFPGLSENSVAIGEVLAIFPDEYMGLEELGFVDPVWVRYGQEGECIADYEACMTASREATPAEYAALMAGQGPHFSDLEPCGHRTEEGQITSAFNDLSCVHDIIDALRGSWHEGDLSRDELEFRLDICLQLVDRSLHRFESQAATGEDHDGQPARVGDDGVVEVLVVVPATLQVPTGKRAMDVSIDEEKRKDQRSGR